MKVSSKSGSARSAQSVGGGRPASGPSMAVSRPVSSVSTTEDALSVSSSAQLVAVAEAKLAQVPDVRLEKIAALKAQMDSEDYHPDGDAVADGLVREHTPPRNGV